MKSAKQPYRRSRDSESQSVTAKKRYWLHVCRVGMGGEEHRYDHEPDPALCKTLYVEVHKGTETTYTWNLEAIRGGQHQVSWPIRPRGNGWMMHECGVEGSAGKRWTSWRRSVRDRVFSRRVK